MIQILPDYLCDELEFPRTQASKFYSKVNKLLTERLDKDPPPTKRDKVSVGNGS